MLAALGIFSVVPHAVRERDVIGFLPTKFVSVVIRCPMTDTDMLEFQASAGNGPVDVRFLCDDQRRSRRAGTAGFMDLEKPVTQASRHPVQKSCFLPQPFGWTEEARDLPPIDLKRPLHRILADRQQVEGDLDITVAPEEGDGILSSGHRPGFGSCQFCDCGCGIDKSLTDKSRGGPGFIGKCILRFPARDFVFGQIMLVEQTRDGLGREHRFGFGSPTLDRDVSQSTNTLDQCLAAQCSFL